MQWEDSVMGPDDKRAELDKIARAQAINKAAAEKAAKEKEKADAQAAREKEKADAAPKTSKRGGEVALPTLPDEDSGNVSKSKNGKNGKTSEISPKLETAAAATPPPPVKHGDDKFIDGLLKDDGGKKKHKASAADDKALDDLLAVEKPKAAPSGKGKKKGDDVDSLLSSADKAPPMPETHVKHETPEWAKPEISSTPVEAPMPLRQAPKRNDGIIHVTQGAAPVASSTPASRRTPAAAPPPPARPAPVATRSTNSRRQPAADSNSWNDPFAVKGPKKTVAARASRGGDSGADDLDNMVPVNRRHPPSPARSDDDDASSFRNAKAPAGTRRAAPAAKPKWKDPFTQSEAPAPAPARAKVAARTAAPAAARTTIATREPQKGESSKWELAAHHSSAAAESPTQGRSSGRWGVLKKRTR
ncbi:MAG TPA: hypothetical protein VGP64_17125 [Polyangia bacterium]